MGYYKHHTIVVTSWDEKAIDEAHARAVEVCGVADGPEVSSVTPVAINGFCSFFVAPDGSKEGWGESDRGDKARATLIEWLSQAACVDWIEVAFGGDDETINVRSAVLSIRGWEADDGPHAKAESADESEAA